MNVPRWPVVGVGLAVLWLFLRGVTPATLLPEFLTGLAFGLPLAFFLRGFYTPRVTLGHDLRAPFYAVLYVFVFLKELSTANLDVAYRVLAPSMPIDPDVVAVPLRVETDLAVTTIANSISLTPGTLTMDHDHETNVLYVHAIDGSDRDAILSTVRTWEDYALVVFDEEGHPEDPTPEPPGVGSGREQPQRDGGASGSGGGGESNGR